MFAPSKIKTGARAVALALALATSSFSAHAVLERAGPVSNVPSVGGFPAWYQDTTGIALEFCAPQNAQEVSGGWCLLLPGTVGPVPETFPTNFFIEHFYFAATAVMAHQTGAHSLLVLAEEASFTNGFNIVPGEQMTFSRIRMKLDPIPVTGTYRFIHPYGEELLQGDAGGRIFFTDDVGINCPGTFTCSLSSRMGPWLLPSTTPGGAEMAALTAANPTPDTDPAHFGGAFAPTAHPGGAQAYIADPARIGPVTGSALPNFIDSTGASRNHNVFRIEGPPGSALGINPATGAVVDWAETTDFNLAGRLFSGSMPGVATVSRASYTRNPTAQKLDVLAVGQAATASRFPTQPQAGKVVPTLTFFDAPCAGTVNAAGTILPPFSAPLGATETQMLATGQFYWGQTRPAVLPSVVCVKNGNSRDVAGNLVPVYLPQGVTDEVTITQALYDPSTNSLTVKATSSDTTIPPVLTTSYTGFTAPLVAGQIVVPNVFAPPAKVTVLSSAAGSNQYDVSSNIQGAAAAGSPVATADAFTFAEDSGPHILAVLANDLFAAGGTVTLTSAPSIGTAVVNVDGTVTYTSNANANGTDSFTYTVTVGTLVSGIGTVSLTITPVNDAPVAVNDAATTTINVPININVLANDTDPDGAADLFAAVALTQPTPAGATVTGGAGGIVTFNATTAGTYTFTYRAQDRSLTSSVNTGRVTVTVTAPQAVVFTSNKYTVANRTLNMVGSIVPAPAGNVNVTFELTNNAGVVLGTVPVGVAGVVTVVGGKFAITSSAFTLPVGATQIKATTAAGVSVSTALVIK